MSVVAFHQFTPYVWFQKFDEAIKPSQQKYGLDATAHPDKVNELMTKLGYTKGGDGLWADARKRLEVTVTSAVELDAELLERIGEEIKRRTGREIDLQAVVDDGVLGGLVLRVGNMVFDASVRNKLERLRKEVAKAA